MEEINQMIIAYNSPDVLPPTGGGDDTEEDETNTGTLILDATCAPQNISYSQDVNLLNEAREKLEKMIYTFVMSKTITSQECTVRKLKKTIRTWQSVKNVQPRKSARQ